MSIKNDYPLNKKSYGLYCLTVEGQKSNLTEITLSNAEICISKDKQTGLWCELNSSSDGDKTMMLGAICGDIAGSVYEFNNIKYCLNPQNLISIDAGFTDDTVMTCAVAEGLKKALSEIAVAEIVDNQYDKTITDKIVKSLLKYGEMYPGVGYGPSFYRWLMAEHHEPYNSWGNGAAMRASYAGWVAKTMFEAEHFGELTAKVTHNHPEGIKAASVIAGCIFMMRSGSNKSDVSEYVNQYYNIDFTLDEIRADYQFDVSCQGSVPQAIVAFLEGQDFSDVIARAISIGGDSDTIAAISGSLAEAYYPISKKLRRQILEKLDTNLKATLIEVIDYALFRSGHVLVELN